MVKVPQDEALAAREQSFDRPHFRPEQLQLVCAALRYETETPKALEVTQHHFI